MRSLGNTPLRKIDVVSFVEAGARFDTTRPHQSESQTVHRYPRPSIDNRIGWISASGRSSGTLLMRRSLATIIEGFIRLMVRAYRSALPNIDTPIIQRRPPAQLRELRQNHEQLAGASVQQAPFARPPPLFGGKFTRQQSVESAQQTFDVLGGAACSPRPVSSSKPTGHLGQPAEQGQPQPMHSYSFCGNAILQSRAYQRNVSQGRMPQHRINTASIDISAELDVTQAFGRHALLGVPSYQLLLRIAKIAREGAQRRCRATSQAPEPNRCCPHSSR